MVLIKRQETEQEVEELKMLRFSLGVMGMNRMRNEYIRGTVQFGHFRDQVCGQILFVVLFGEAHRRNSGYTVRGMFMWRLMDVVREDMQVSESSSVNMSGVRNNQCFWPYVETLLCHIPNVWASFVPQVYVITSPP